MKHFLIILPIILMMNNMPYSQIATQGDVSKHPKRYPETKTLSIVDEFSKEGVLETFNAEVFRKISKDTYWVKNAELLDSKNDVILELGTYLYSNGTKVLNQVPAVNGYVIEFVGSPANWKNLFIWLSNENGERDSDLISLEFNKYFTIVY